MFVQRSVMAIDLQPFYPNAKVICILSLENLIWGFTKVHTATISSEPVETSDLPEVFVAPVGNGLQTTSEAIFGPQSP